MNDTQANLLWQMMQSMNVGGNYQNMQEALQQFQDSQPPPVPLPSPLDTLYMMRAMLPLKEQRMIDLMVKIQELKLLMDEIQSIS